MQLSRLARGATTSSSVHLGEISTPRSAHETMHGLTSCSTRLPTKLSTILTSSQIQQVHHVALGFEDSFLLTYRDKYGRNHIGTFPYASSQKAVHD